MGRAGRSAALTLAERFGADVVAACDAASSDATAAVAGELRAAGVTAFVGEAGPALLERWQPGCVVKSPGMPLDDALVAAARDRGLEVLDEAELGWRLDRRPTVAVTGTNGKSTVCALVAAVLEGAGASPVVAGNTVFGPPLSALAGEEADVVVAELSSFQLAAAPALLPELAVLTNVSDDHWEHHGGRDRYVAAKRRLFVRDGRVVPIAVVNADDADAVALGEEVARRGGRVVRFGATAGEIRLRDARWTLAESLVRLTVEGRDLDLTTRLVGRHNAANAAASLAVAAGLDLDLDTAVAAIEGCEPVPGRMEPIDAGQGFGVVVDYAHNPAGIEAVLATVRAADDVTGRVIAVSSGLAVLHPRQNHAAGRALAGADLTILSVERIGPSEPADTPAPGLLEGVSAAGREATVVPDRREAIRHAVGRARPGDVVVLLNRGVRRTPMLDAAGERYVVDDRDEARAAIREALG